MDLHDSNPERRNLSALSLAIILYYCAGGAFVSNELRLLVATIHFERPGVVAAFVWVALFWFLYRYRLHHKGFRKAFRPEVHAQSAVMQSLLARVLDDDRARKIVPKGCDFKSIGKARINWTEPQGHWTFSYRVDGSLTRADGVVTAETWGAQEVRPRGAAQHLALWWAIVRALFLEKSASSMLAPYLLCILAVASGLIARLGG